MSYGMKVEGNDVGGNFIVTDTDLGLVNLQVVDSGTNDHTITLDTALQPTDLLFVKSPQPGGQDSGGYDQQVYSEYVDGSTRYMYLSSPRYYFNLLSNNNKTIDFKGGSWGTINSANRGSVNYYFYNDWDVAFDWFLVKNIQDLSLSNDNYGIQILTSGGGTAFDSRAIVGDQTFNINGVAQPYNSWGQLLSARSFTFGETNSYVNIEWATILDTNQLTVNGGSGGHRIFGLGLTSSQATVYNGFKDGEPESPITWFGNGFSLFSSKLFTGAPSGSGSVGGSTGNALSGSLSLVDTTSVLREGNTNTDISYNASVNTSGSYNIKVTRDTGTVGGGELGNTSTTFNGTSGSLTIISVNDSASEIGYQGETFTISLRTGSVVGSGDLLDAQNFTLYDDDSGITLIGASSGEYEISSTATYADVSFSLSTVGSSIVPARIVLSGGTTAIKSFGIPSNTTVTPRLSSNLPTSGSSDYTMQVSPDAGISWIDGVDFTIKRVSGSTGGTSPLSNPNPVDNTINIDSNAFSAEVSFTGLVSGEQLRILQNSTQVVSAYISSSPQTFYVNSNLPSAGTTLYYTTQVRIGGGSWVPKASGNFSITKASSGPSGPPLNGGGGFGEN